MSPGYGLVIFPVALLFLHVIPRLLPSSASSRLLLQHTLIDPLPQLQESFRLSLPPSVAPSTISPHKKVLDSHCQLSAPSCFRVWPSPFFFQRRGRKVLLSLFISIHSFSCPTTFTECPTPYAGSETALRIKLSTHGADTSKDWAAIPKPAASV